MKISERWIQALFAPATLLALFLAALFFRPVLPIDETRYMSVAWEMWLRSGWLEPLTLNFQPYHHKPPLLFWLINASWAVFGVSRWAGLMPVVLMAGACVYLTRALAHRLFPQEKFEVLPVLMMGSVPFLIYNTLIMFDVTLSVFVLCTFLALVSYAQERKARYIAGMALAMGLGVLTKGPVAWLYVIFPVLLGPWWIKDIQGRGSWYGGCAAAFALSTIPVLMWLIPVLKASNPDFAFWLVWEQTAGRITGKMGSAHHRPFYFYLPLLPVLFLPWAFFPLFWRGVREVKNTFEDTPGLRFLACWVVPVFLAFSLIGGKQPHYLIPLLPGALIFTAYVMRMSFGRAAQVSAVMVFLFVTGQAALSQNFLKRYDLQPLADYVRAHEDRDWAFAGKYQGELVFPGRLRQPFESVRRDALRAWFLDHPNGLAVIKYRDPAETQDFEMLLTRPYRSQSIGVFAAPVAAHKK